MKAVQVTEFGEAKVLALTELPDPAPGPGEVAIDVTHAAVGLIDVYLRQGRYEGVPGLPQPPYVPGLEVAGTVRALGEGVTDLQVGEKVVTLSASATGGYASVYVSDRARVLSTQAYHLAPALAVAVVPNALMAHVALTGPIRLNPGERVLVHGAFGALAAAFPGVARQLGASRVVGTVRGDRVATAATSRLPYDKIVDSATMLSVLGDERFDVIVDPVGGQVRTESLQLLAPGGRLLLVGNASDEWEHGVNGNAIWQGNVIVAGFNAGGYLPAHPEAVPAAAAAALTAASSGLADTEIELLPLAEAATAHQRLQEHTTRGRVVLVP
ncbi:quinone oxidoreductase family protein [Micromonospora yangpuensis]|uniref:NADPH2:quinone reductase n=1 Tax=Micromonospora yangpuensis TaxID=683228 RepID=A0A1C6UWA9_9ACTN|nr:zinc-binding dehydrogenase [Micromonospora yangpuensis]GGM25466.1 NADPH:quinone reductase [Micromonospora yangpuensis]SCL58300.1 NADPH2:quinone reductase [Micromonospora yangpuensis]